jgi:hypothetical protein
MHRTFGVIVVAKKGAGQLIRTRREVVDSVAVVVDADVGFTDDRRVDRARCQIFVITCRQSILVGEGLRDFREWRRTAAG